MENSLVCQSNNNPVSINFSGNTISSGETWVYLNDSDTYTAGRVCVSVIDGTDDVNSPYSAYTQYNSCYECDVDNYTFYVFRTCNTGEIYLFPISEFGEDFYNTGFTIYSVFYIEFEYQGGIIKSCGLIEKVQREVSEQQNNEIIDKDVYSTLISYSDYYEGDGACKDCEIDNPNLIALVTECISGDAYYVLLPSTGLEDHLISFTDGINEYCGVVEVYEESFEYLDFLLDYGFNSDCDTCLSLVNKKVLIQNCLDSNIQYVVWAAQLFQNGDITNLTFEEGCFEVVGETTDEVNFNIPLDVETYNDCNNCLECNGVFYEFATCDNPGELIGTILSYQIIPVDGVFYSPTYGWCVRKNAVITPTTPYDTLYSVLLANDCGDVPFTPKVVYVEECISRKSYFVITDDSRNLGDIIQLIRGENNYFCGEIVGLDPFYEIGSEFYNTVNDGITTTTFNDCDECTSNTTIAIKAINCYDNSVETVDLSYLDYVSMFFENSPSTFVGSDNICRTVQKFCPQELTGNLLTITDNYLNCFICEIFNPEPPTPMKRSAGVESIICNTCDDVESVTATTVPHAIYTTLKGVAILQINTVALGGFNGLNN